MTSRRTVIVNIYSGWGNQLFQAAHGYAIARKLGADLLFELARVNCDPVNKYALGPFEEALGAALWKGQAFVGRRLKVQVIRQILARLRLHPRTRMQVIREGSLRWRPIDCDPRSDLYLIGFWQSERYFADYSSDLRKALSPVRFADAELNPLIGRLSSTPSVSVHVRRGDYVRLAVNRTRYVCLGRDYYQAAAQRIRSSEPNAEFHVFSDEPEEAAALFEGLKGFTIHPRRSQEQDLLLMSSCRHHVIANSTFSWWAAWLGSGPGRTTVAPVRWYQERTAESRQTQDLIPQGWLRC